MPDIGDFFREVNAMFAADERKARDDEAENCARVAETIAGEATNPVVAALAQNIADRIRDRIVERAKAAQARS